MTRARGILALLGSLFLLAALSTPAFAQQKKPNILVIFGDDIGFWNISAYNRGMMGYRTPNIDRIAKEGAIFTDLYAQQSCTAGRAAFITGQSCFRTGLLKVGLPGAKEGLSEKDPTLAELLKPQGYATGQFGKNHLGDRNEFLPTVHGFDEFFGNLYHLNAEDEPENPDYPKDPEFRAKFGPRGVLKCVATDKDDPTEDPRFGRVGKQKIEDTGPLTKKRMETVDEEFLGAAMDFIDRQHKAGKPFFCWFNSTRMHIYTHLKPASKGKTGLGIEADGMVELDGMVGQLLKQLDDLGIADNTIVAVDHRQRRRSLLVARRRHHAVPRREEHQLGRRLPRARHDPLAGRHQAGHRDQRHRVPRGLGADLGGGGRRAERQGEAADRLRSGGQDLQGPPRRLRPARSAGRHRARASARSSSTGPTTATSPACAMTAGSLCSWSSGPKA